MPYPMNWLRSDREINEDDMNAALQDAHTSGANGLDESALRILNAPDESTTVDLPHPSIDMPRERPQFSDVPKSPDQSPAQDQQDPEIHKLLSDLESAQDKDYHGAHSRRRSMLTLLAGQAVSSGIGGLPETIKYHEVDIPERGKQAQERINSREKMMNGATDRKHTSSETNLNNQKYDSGKIDLEVKRRLADVSSDISGVARQMFKELTKKDAPGWMSAADVFEVRPEIKELVSKELAKAKSDQDESQFNRQEGRIVSEGDKNRLNALAVAGLKGTNTSNQRVADEAYKAALARAEAETKDWVPDGPVSQHDRAKAHDRIASAEMLRTSIEDAVSFIDRAGRPGYKWSTDEAAQIKSLMASAYEANVKYEGDGVMNGKDMQNAISKLGDQQSLENFIQQNGLASLKQAARTVDRQLARVMSQYKFHHRAANEPYAQAPDPSNFQGSGGSSPALSAGAIGKLGGWVNSGGKQEFPNLDQDKNKPPGRKIRVTANGDIIQ